jgi:hypothetical protein
MDSNEATQAQPSEGDDQGHLPRYSYLQFLLSMTRTPPTWRFCCG